ncbi:hypothetical protein [Nocardia vinacea]|uniref:hypothetical protein n=1 Tax=Nocardia vinacea TaxID=96468 RepID=UPI0002E2AE94|nr:hypothetical protein [Nocardia vinacea]
MSANFDVRGSDLEDERIMAEYRGSAERVDDDGDLAEAGMISEVDLRLWGYRKQDLESLFGPRTEITASGRQVWNLDHVRAIEAQQLAPFRGRIMRELRHCLDIETALEALEHMFDTLGQPAIDR